MIQVQTRNDDLSWTNQKSLSNSGGIIDLTFTQVFKEVRFVRVSGDGVPLCTSLSTKAPSFVESFGTSPNNRYEIPEVVESGGGGPGGSNFTISDVPPSNPNVGDWWLNNSTGILYTWIDDGDTEVWVELGDSNGIGFGGEDEEDEASNEYGQAIMIGSGPSPIDSFSAVSYRSAKYQMQISDGTDYETCTVYLIHDGTEVYLSTYGNIFSNESMGEFDAELEDGTITISFTATVSNSKVIKFRRSLIDS